MANKKYYLIEKERSSEGAVLFWKKNKCGYTSNFEIAGLYDIEDVKEHYMGKSKETYAIEKKKLEKIMKTIRIVYNYSDFYNLMYDIDNDANVSKDNRWIDNSKDNTELESNDVNVSGGDDE